MGAVKNIREHTEVSLPPAQSHRINVKRVLVVEDDSSISRLLSELLTDWGFEVFTASNGREGLDVLNAQPVDGVVLDLEMPIMDGWTMLDELRWQGDHTPVIVMSGGVDHQVLRDMLNEGAQGFLVKPFTLDTLRTQCDGCFVRDKKGVSFDSTGATDTRIAARHREVA